MSNRYGRRWREGGKPHEKRPTSYQQGNKEHEAGTERYALLRKSQNVYSLNQYTAYNGIMDVPEALQLAHYGDKRKAAAMLAAAKELESSASGSITTSRCNDKPQRRIEA